MAQLNLTLDEEILKELMLGNRDEAVTKLLEAVFNASMIPVKPLNQET